MKSERGITLESLAIYIVVLMVVMGIMTTLTSTFYNNMQYIDVEGEFAMEYGKFNSSLLTDSKQSSVKLVQVSEKNKKIFLLNTNTDEEITYSFLDTGIYRNEVLISNKLKGTLKVDNNNEKLVSILLEYSARNGQGYTKSLDFYFE